MINTTHVIGLCEISEQINSFICESLPFNDQFPDLLFQRLTPRILKRLTANNSDNLLFQKFFLKFDRNFFF